MADNTHKLPENVPGPWYVDDTCKPCRVCLDVAGADDFLMYNDDESYVYFYKQPAGAAQLAAADDAMAVCPENAIGSDGE